MAIGNKFKNISSRLDGTNAIVGWTHLKCLRGWFYWRQNRKSREITGSRWKSKKKHFSPPPKSTDRYFRLKSRLRIEMEQTRTTVKPDGRAKTAREIRSPCMCARHGVYLRRESGGGRTGGSDSVPRLPESLGAVGAAGAAATASACPTPGGTDGRGGTCTCSLLICDPVLRRTVRPPGERASRRYPYDIYAVNVFRSESSCRE